MKRDGTVRRPPLHSCVWRKRGMLCSCGECWVWAMTYWHLILPEFHLTHGLLSDTLSSYRSWPRSHSCFLWGDTPLLFSAIKPNHTHVCSLHAVHTLTHIYPSLPNMYYPVSFLKWHVNLKIICLCTTFHMCLGVHSWQRQHLVDENVTAGTGQQNVEIMFRRD